MAKYKVGDQVMTRFSEFPVTITHLAQGAVKSGWYVNYTGRDADGWPYDFGDDDVRELIADPINTPSITATPEPITSESLNFTPTDTVNHPPHYNFGDIEVIDYIKQVTETYDGGFTAYCIGNVLKYVSRAQHKGNPSEDLRKAEWYLRKAIENETE